MTTAVITMVYNESVYLPIWRKYYGSLFGDRNLYVVDHGSDDGSTSEMGDVNIISIPRSPMNNLKRSKFISQLATALLGYFESVVYIDVDEMLIVDPRLGISLPDFCANGEGPIETALGFNLFHEFGVEPDLDLAQPVLSQRKWLFGTAFMCKPAVIRKPVNWHPGFHGCDFIPSLNGLHLIHLRHYDVNLGLARLSKTRTMPWSSERAGSHQRLIDDDWTKILKRYSAMPKGPALFDTKSDQELVRFKEALIDSMHVVERKDRCIEYKLWGIDMASLLQVPESMRSYF